MLGNTSPAHQNLMPQSAMWKSYLNKYGSRAAKFKLIASELETIRELYEFNRSNFRRFNKQYPDFPWHRRIRRRRYPRKAGRKKNKH